MHEEGLLFHEKAKKKLIVAPKSLVPRLIAEAHEDLLIHPGWEKVRDRIQRNWIWKDIEADVKGVVQACDPCQRYKNPRNSKPPIKMLDTDGVPFSKICMDVSGPWNLTTKKQQIHSGGNVYEDKICGNVPIVECHSYCCRRHLV